MSFPKPRAPAVAFFAIALAVCSAHAQDFRPGLWELTASNLPKPHTFCFTNDMRKDPQVEAQKYGADCKKGDETVSGDTVTYWISCTTPKGPQTSRVTVTTHAPDHFTMTTDFAANTPGGPVMRKGVMTYKRVGECN